MKKVILCEKVENLGEKGTIWEVPDGYARNFLIKKKLAVFANKKNESLLAQQKQKLEKERLLQREKAKELLEKINHFSFKISRKVGESDKLFGSVTTSDIEEKLKEAGFNIEKRWIHLENPLKTLGKHFVEIRMDAEFSAKVQVWIVKEE